MNANSISALTNQESAQTAALVGPGSKPKARPRLHGGMSGRSERYERRVFSLFDFPPTIYRNEPLQRLGKAMDAGLAGGTTSGIPSGYVYLGQLVAHDISEVIRPTLEFAHSSQLLQASTPALDLDCIYGTGFDDSRVAKDKDDRAKLRLGDWLKGDKGKIFYDLPRAGDEKALIPDGRNDENAILSQLHVQFLKLHNRFVDQDRANNPKGTDEDRFNRARKNTILCYQEIVIFDLLRRVLDPVVWNYYFGESTRPRRFILDPARGQLPSTPVELIAAAFRFGHSMVRDSYVTNDKSHVDTAELIHGDRVLKPGDSRRLSAKTAINWKFFFDIESRRPSGFNLSRRIDPLAHVRLNTKVDPVLATRNLLTGNALLLPDAQSIVTHLRTHYPDLVSEIGVPLLSPDELNVAAMFVDSNAPKNEAPRTRRLFEGVQKFEFGRKTPLWYYLLAEALVVREGRALGPLGSIIVAEAFRGLIRTSTTTILDDRADDNAIARTGQSGGRPYLTMADVLKAVDTVEPKH